MDTGPQVGTQVDTELADTVGMAPARLAVVPTRVRETAVAGSVPARQRPRWPESWMESVDSFVSAVNVAIRDPNVKSLILHELLRFLREESVAENHQRCLEWTTKRLFGPLRALGPTKEKTKGFAWNGRRQICHT